MRSTRNSIRRRHDGKRGSGDSPIGPGNMPAGQHEPPLWIPDPDRIARANLTTFLKHIQESRPAGAEAVGDFTSLYRWSVERPDAFWPEIWRFCGVITEE